MFSFVNLFGLIVVTAYMALMYRNESMVLLAYMEVTLFVLSFLWLLFRRITISGSIDVPIGISEAEKENLVKIKIRNKTRIPVTRMKAFIIVEDTVRGYKNWSWMKLPEVSAGENIFIKSIIFPGTGNYRISLKRIRVYDWTGLLYKDINVKSIENVQVMPQVHDVSVRLTLATKNFYGEADVYDENMPGYDNSELFEVREYQKGDRIQNVHWKLSAKQDEIMVKEHSLPKACPVILCLDFGHKKNTKLKEKALAFMEIAVSISFSIMDAGCPHYIAWYDAREMDIKRVRVDDEESLFYFMGMLMQIKWETAPTNIVEIYKEKYKREPYVWMLSLDKDLLLKKEDEVLAKFSEKNIEDTLGSIEILL